MAVLRMRFLQDPVLRQQAKKIGKILPSLKRLTGNMIETMYDQKGVGIAANQVGSLQKVCIIQTPEMEEPLVLINPQIIKREGEREVVEGCLSIPGYRGTVKRSVKVRARALGLDGKVIRINADELLAQALEHETDHLNGKLYVDCLVSRDSIWKIIEEDAGDDESSEDESSEDESSEDESSDDEPSDDEPSDDEPSDDEPSDDEPSDDEPSDDEPSGDGPEKD